MILPKPKFARAFAWARAHTSTRIIWTVILHKSLVGFGLWSLYTCISGKSIIQWRHLVSKALIQIDNNSNLIVLEHKHCLRTHTQILVGWLWPTFEIISSISHERTPQNHPTMHCDISKQPRLLYIGGGRNPFNKIRQWNIYSFNGVISFTFVCILVY